MQLELFLQFLSLHVAGSLQSSFCSRGHIAWKKMLVEEFQDDCLVHDHLLSVDGMIVAILSLSVALRIPPCLCSIEYMGFKR